MIKAVIADDIQILRQGLRAILEQDKDIQVVGLAADGREAWQLCRKHRPDVVLMDMRMPEYDGSYGITRIKEDYPDIKVLVLTTFDDRETVDAAVGSGADGYILKEMEDDKVIPSAVKDGEIYPVDYCISTIARLIQQPHGAEVVCGIRNALSELFEAADTQFIYPDESLHVSLLGCTQRKNTNVFEHAQINKIKHICIKEIEKKEPAEIILRGIGIVGNQIFIQGFPQNRNWV